MSKGEIIIYQTADGSTSLDVKLEQETIWLNQKQIAELFGTKRPAITKHLKNIFLSGELEENRVCSILEHTTPHGAMADKTQTTEVKYYNLDAILSVGYRVNSKNATRFRIWANKVLKEYLIKGYVVKENIKLEQYEDLKQTIKVLAMFSTTRRWNTLRQPDCYEWLLIMLTLLIRLTDTIINNLR